MQFLRRPWPWPEILILALAAALRFTALDLKPPHFDEGVNGWFADQMAHTGYYAYDPTNYHGPLHMYAVFVSQKLFGRDLFALRLPAVLASLGAVWLTLRFGRFLGVNTARWAAAAMAVSPACVFYARYSIHESWLLAFLLLTAWGILDLWQNGTRAGLHALAGGIAGMILTKETYFIHLGCFALAIPCLLVWQLASPSRPAVPLAPQRWTSREAGLAAGAAVFAIVFFYSGTFLHWQGLAGLYETYAAWFKTGVGASGHNKPEDQLGPFNYYWFLLLARYEWPALIGLAACIRLLWPAPAHLRYLAIYGAGALVAYTIIPYKTPWLLLVLLWPFFFTFGALVEECSRAAVGSAAALMLASACVTASMMRGAQLNFRDFANPAEPYVYVQTFPEIRRLTDPLLTLAQTNPAAHGLTGEILLDSYYPLPWMLGDFPNVAYRKDTEWPDPLAADFIAAEKKKAERVEKLLREPYYRREFRLRDAQEDCVAWFRVAAFRSLLRGEPTVGPQPSPSPR
ncbi:MAG: TIGR03663 family protein [Terrimicrobiaceae bacterium]|nr:TIGR03663 family protein [Terrimicrobiaceae bacterium]